MSSSQLIIDQPEKSIRPRTKSESRRIQDGISDSWEIVEQVQQEVDVVPFFRSNAFYCPYGNWIKGSWYMVEKTKCARDLLCNQCCVTK